VLGVAAAAKVRVLLVFGLLVSIPLICVGDSQLVLKLITAFPFIITRRALLGYVAGEMLVGEALLQHWSRRSIICIGWYRDFAPCWCCIGRCWALRKPFPSSGRSGGRNSEQQNRKGGKYEILIPVDGSANALRAVEHVSEISLPEERPQLLCERAVECGDRNVKLFH